MTQPLSIAVVGVSALFPGSADSRGFWQDILEGRDLITDVPPTHWLLEDYYDPDPAAPDKTYSRRGAFLRPTDFDPLEFGIPPSIIPATDTAQLLALIVAQRVLEDATAGQFSRMDRDRASVILGIASAQELLASMAGRLQKPVWLKALRENGVPEDEAQKICERAMASYVPWQEATFPGLLGNVVAGRIANRFDLRGTNCVTDAACASALSALSMAVNELVVGQSDLVITGGVDTLNDVLMYLCFSKTLALSRSGECRPFSDMADGTLLGEGLAMMALKRLADAERDGDRIYGVIRGLGSSSDGRSKSVYAPLAEGQARALRRTYQQAGYGPATVELMEAHGTGTKAGDAAEFEGLRMVFEESGRADRQWCALGSVKSQVGHTKSTAGAAGLFKALMSVHHGVLPPTIKVDRPHPALQLEKSPFHLSTRTRPWVRGSDHPRRASVSSFGFGGSNFHVTLEEYRGPGQRAPRLHAWPWELVALAEETPAALAQACRKMAEEAGAHGSLSWLAYRSQRDLRPAASRLAVVASDAGDLKAQLEQASRRIAASPGEAFSTPAGAHYASGAAPGKVAFLFPGQGSQYAGMGAELAVHLEEARAVWDEAADLGLGLHQVVFPVPPFTDAEREQQQRRLTETQWAQPAIGAASAALLQVLERVGLRPDCVAGHSFGELSALHAAGALDRASLLRLARRRGELMAEAARAPGAMTAVTAAVKDVEALLGEGGEVVIANHNHPSQVVLAGPVPAIEETEQRLRARGVAVQRLKVATAFHSPVVAGAVAPFRAFLDGVPFGPARAAVYGNATAAPYPGDPAGMREQLARQLVSPVRFAEQIEAMYESGVRTFVEVGPGSVLAGLVDRILGDRPHQAVGLDREGRHGLLSLWSGLGRLIVAGLPVQPLPLWAPHAPPADPATRKRPQMAVALTGTNHGKPYPPPGGAKDLPPPNPPRPPPEIAAAPPAPAPLAGTDGQVAWLSAYQEIQRQTADAHAAYQRAAAESHATFLRTIEASFAGLGSLAGAAPEPAGLELAPESARSLQPPPPPALAPAPLTVSSAPSSTSSAPTPAPTRKAPPPAPAPAPAPAASLDVEALMLKVVAEKTGYPVEMIQPGMELEADLGIDSIKRVEILSSLRERAPGLPEVAPSELGALRTIGQISERLRRDGGGAGAGPAPAPAPAASLDVEALMLKVVAEKTGYPVEMIQPGMELEADLGIDSIKRVEILSTLRERAPGLPEVAPSELGALRTIGQISQRLRAGTGSSPKAPPPAAPAAGEAAIRRLVTAEIAAPAEGVPLPGLRSPVAVTDEGTGIAGALVRRLAARGFSARVAGEVPADAAAVVFLGGLRPVEDAGAALAVEREAFRAARAVAAGEARGGAFVVVQDTGGDFGLSGAAGDRAWLAGLAALARTAAREWPGVPVKAIDVERGGRTADQVAEALERELLEGGAAPEVGLRADGRRTAPATREAPASPGGAWLRPASVLVATGGGRGVTAAALVALARARRPRLVLVGRTPLGEEPPACRGIDGEAALKNALLGAARQEGRSVTPVELGAAVARVLAGREVAATLASLREAGSEVRYLAVDARDAAALGAALDGVRREWGPIAGIVHGAGVLADKRIAEKTPEQFDAVFDTKVEVLRALLAATAADPLELICLFSSVAARTGNAGQSDYAMANEVLNAVASAERRRRGGACRVRSIAWGPWEGGMVTPSLRAHFQRQGVPLIPLAQGARMFVEEVEAPADGAVQVVIAGGMGAGPKGAEQDLEVHVSARSHPYLADHSIRGTPVVPLVLAVEWFVRAARACRPDLHAVRCRDVKVLRGIRLERFQDGGDRFTVRCRPAEGGAALAVELVGQGGLLHYSATVETGARPPAAAPLETRGPAALEPGPVPIYDGQVLFHGPGFHAIRSLDGVSPDGSAGVLAGARELGWREDAWCTDPALLDGGLQLAVLWGQRVLGGASLPTAVTACEVLAQGLSSGPVRCAVRGTEVSGPRATCDVSFAGQDGTVLAELRGVELHALPR